VVGETEGLGRDIALEYYALDCASAIAYLEEVELATRPLIVQPTL
jgi:hypothetical protein